MRRDAISRVQETRVDHSLYARLGKQYAEQVCQVLGRVGEMDNGTSLERFVGTGGGGGKEIREHGRLCSYESSIDAESGFTSDEDKVAILIPDLGVAVEIGGRSR